MRPKRMGDILNELLVSEAMTSRVVTIAAETSLAEAQEIMMQFGHTVYPVMEGQELLGVITYARLMDALRKMDPESPVKTMVSEDFVTISMERTLKDAVRLLAHEDVSRLLVVSDENTRHVIGILSRSDVIKCYEEKASET